MHSEVPLSVLDYMNGFQHRVYVAGEKARENLASPQKKMKNLYDGRAKTRKFSPGD